MEKAGTYALSFVFALVFVAIVLCMVVATINKVFPSFHMGFNLFFDALTIWGIYLVFPYALRFTNKYFPEEEK